MLANDVLTPEEAAEFLKLNPRTVHGYLREGLIPAKKIGKFWRLSRQCLEDWLGAGASELTQELLLAFDSARDEVSRGDACSLDDYLIRRPQMALDVPCDPAPACGAPTR